MCIWRNLPAVTVGRLTRYFLPRQNLVTNSPPQTVPFMPPRARLSYNLFRLCHNWRV